MGLPSSSAANSLILLFRSSQTSSTPSSYFFRCFCFLWMSLVYTHVHRLAEEDAIGVVVPDASSRSTLTESYFAGINVERVVGSNVQVS